MSRTQGQEDSTVKIVSRLHQKSKMRIFKCSFAKCFQGSMAPDLFEGVAPSALPLMQFVTSQYFYPPFYAPPPDFAGTATATTVYGTTC